MYDLFNVLIIIIFILTAFHFRFVPLWLAFVLIIYTFTPFFLNDYLFPTSFMPDQFRYISYVKEIRDLNFDYTDHSHAVTWASWMLSFIPLPVVDSVHSLGFFNRLIATTLIIWIYFYLKLRGIALFMFLIYPSFLIYSSLALRDTLILLFMLLSVSLYLRGRIIYSLIILSPLISLKFQNYLMVIIFYLFHYSFGGKLKIYNFKYLLLILGFAMVWIFKDQLVESIDYYRGAMFREDGGNMDDYNSVDNLADLFITGLLSTFNFMAKPLLWEAANLFQLILSLENIWLIFLLFIFFRKIYKNEPIIFFKWFVGLLFCFSIYGLVVSNAGTSGRYKFPIILFFVVGASYESKLRRQKVENKKLNPNIIISN
jgi:hypothetical protein